MTNTGLAPASSHWSTKEFPADLAGNPPLTHLSIPLRKSWHNQVKLGEIRVLQQPLAGRNQGT